VRDEHDGGTPDAMRSAEGQSQPDRAESPEEQLATIRRARQARVVKVLVAVAIVILLIIFIIDNAQPVKVNFVFLSRHPRLIWVMIVCAGLGGVAGYLIGKPGRQVLSSRRRKERRPRS
jgi:uncharacterized integral membrane protein